MSTRAPTRRSSSSIMSSRRTKLPSISSRSNHDDKFTYIKTNAPEKFSVYEMKDGQTQPRHLRPTGRDLHHPEDHGQRICGAGQKEKWNSRAKDNLHDRKHFHFPQRRSGQPANRSAGRAKPCAANNGTAQRRLAKRTSKHSFILGAALLVIVAALSVRPAKKGHATGQRERPAAATGVAGQHRQQTCWS